MGTVDWQKTGATISRPWFTRIVVRPPPLDTHCLPCFKNVLLFKRRDPSIPTVNHADDLKWRNRANGDSMWYSTCTGLRRSITSLSRITEHELQRRTIGTFYELCRKIKSSYRLLIVAGLVYIFQGITDTVKTAEHQRAGRDNYGAARTS